MYRVLVYSSIAGAFGGFFGSPIVGAVGAIEYMFIRELDLYRHLIPGLLAAAVGYGVYFAFLQTSYLGIYNFPDYASPRLVDLWWALLVGVIAGGIGIMYTSSSSELCTSFSLGSRSDQSAVLS